jgi:hypothetical protein
LLLALEDSDQFSFFEGALIDAIFSLAWYCFFRIEEVIKMNIRDVLYDRENGERQPYHLVRVTFRKTNQLDPYSGSKFEVYDVGGDGIITAFSRLSRWMDSRMI